MTTSFLTAARAAAAAAPLLAALAPFAVPTAVPEAAAQTEASQDVDARAKDLQRAFDLFATSFETRSEALAYFETRGEPDAIPYLIQAMRFARGGWHELTETLAVLAGESAGDTWHEWMLWQEAHPEIAPFPGFATFKTEIYARIDDDFSLFLQPDVAHEIRLEEIAWGGVVKDGIPALVNPERVAARDAGAGYLTANELVFGVEINGDARAYPLRILDWHEMFNDVIGGVPVALAYCTLCGSGILFETAVEGRDEPFEFGTSGFLYRSNKLMYDQQTHSLWNQFTGRPVVGSLTGSGIELKTRPVVITSWLKWREKHPDTTVLNLNTGHIREYRPGQPYGRYFASSRLMFPALVDDAELKAKDYVFALRGAGAEKAWRLSDFEGGRVINDQAGVVPLTLVGDAETRTVRAYRTEGQAFTPGSRADEVLFDGATWRVTEAALIGPDGAEAPRLPGHIAYWFAWSGYFGDVGDLAERSE